MKQFDWAFDLTQMSARRPQHTLTPGAARDVRNALLNSEKQWGRAPRGAYRRQLLDAFAQLSQFPELGRVRPEYGHGVRSHRVGQHVDIYQPTDAELRILRLLHARRDAEGVYE